MRRKQQALPLVARRRKPNPRVAALMARDKPHLHWYCAAPDWADIFPSTWLCYGRGKIGNGETREAAHAAWLTKTTC